MLTFTLLAPFKTFHTTTTFGLIVAKWTFRKTFSHDKSPSCRTRDTIGTTRTVTSAATHITAVTNASVAVISLRTNGITLAIL